MQKEKLIIAVDGHSSSGKSTLAKDVAKRLGLRYIDTGAMYRAVTLYALENQMIENGTIHEAGLRQALPEIHIEFRVNSGDGTSDTYLNDRNVEDAIRSMDVSNYVSPISKLKFVRRHLVDLQRKMGEEGGIVMDGRDIGTVVFPDADLKLFVTATPEERAQRRYDELMRKGYQPDYDEVEANLRERDYQDSNREESPLRMAEDARLLDNSNMSREEQMQYVLNLTEQLDR